MRAHEFDGPTAAGCIIVAADTGRWCLQQRSNTVSDPGVWSTWGGGREPGETVTETVLRELAEESGYTGPVTLRLVDSSPSYATFMAVVPHEFEPRINSECQDWQWCEPDDLPEPLHPGLTQTLSENFADDKVKEDRFTNNFSQIDSIITKQYPKEIMNLLLGMFPTAKEAIVNQYNDEDGMPFSEWRRAIYEIDNYILSGPVVVDGAKLPINPEIEADRLAKYQQYIKDKDSGQPARYFRANDSDPRTIDFTKLSPITIAQTDRGMEVADGNHRAFLAKMANKPLRAFVWTKQKNNHPNVAKIKSLFQEINENFADGKNPGRKGLSKRVGIPKKASLSQLQKIASSSTGERRRMAQWQLNMRRGKAKKNK